MEHNYTMRTFVATSLAKYALTAGSFIGIIALSACSTSESSPASTSSASANSATAALTVENCGVPVTFDKAPERVVTYFQHPTEILLALGLEDKIVGHLWPDNAPLDEQADAYNSLNLISEQGTSFEDLVALEPDLIFGGYSSTFSAEQGRDRAKFQDAGINTYLTWESCEGSDAQMGDLYDELRELGTIFGVEEKAETLATELEAAAAIATPEKSTDVFVYDSGEQAPMTIGGSGIGNEVIEAAGGNNIFADVTGNYADVSWEQVAAREPEAVIVLDYFGSTPPEDKIEYLKSRSEITTDRFLVLTLQDTVLGVRAPKAVAAVTEFLHN